VVDVAVGDLTPGLFATGLATPGEVGFVGLTVVVVLGFLVPPTVVGDVTVFFPSFTSGFVFVGDAGVKPGFEAGLVDVTPGVFAVVPVLGFPGVVPSLVGCAPGFPGVLAVVFGFFVPGPGFVATGFPTGFLTGGFFGGTAWN